MSLFAKYYDRVISYCIITLFMMQIPMSSCQ